jgi:competence protein ComEC
VATAVVLVLRRRAPWWCLVGVLMVALGAASMALRVASLDAAPLADWAAAKRAVVAHGVLTRDPETTERTGFGGSTRQVTVTVRAESVTAGTEQADVRAPLLVIGDASGWESLRLGDQVEIGGTLAAASQTEPVAAVLFTDVDPRHLADEGPVLRGAEAMRSGLRQAVAGLPPDVQGLLPALVVGDTSAVTPTLRGDLRASGLAHLTAVSGANVAFVVGAGLVLSRWCGVRGRALPALGLVLVGWFVLLARPQPSVLRAAVMGSLALVAVASAGRVQAIRSLLASVLILLLVDPWLARSWGFALSVAATAGLVLLARRWSGALPVRWPAPVRDATAVALAAQVATLPLVVALSGQVAVLAVVANVLAAPAVPPATVLGAAAAACSPVAPWLASALAWVAQWPTRWIALVAHQAATAPLATLPWPDGWWGGVLSSLLIGLAAIVVAVGRRRHWWRPRRVAALTLAGTAFVAAFLIGPGRWPPPGWVMVACDVGQGDALVVHLGEDSGLVVDAGPDPALVDRCLDRLGVERVPLLVLTHFHADHVDGVPGVMSGRDVGTVLVSPMADPPEQAAAVSAWVQGHRVVEAAPGQSGRSGAASWQVIWPGDPVPSEGSAANNASVVLVVEASSVRLLLTGDIEPEAQAVLLDSGDVPSVDVLKVPHHGSQRQDAEFLTATGASAAVVSVGEDNPYGHPDPALLADLAASGMLIGRTDLDGDVAVVLDDGSLRLVAHE